MWIRLIKEYKRVYRKLPKMGDDVVPEGEESENSEEQSSDDE